jgi:predicted MFS family arabinose efflux permease
MLGWQRVVVTSSRAAADQAVERLDDVLGGPARRHVVVVIALVLALDSADQATVGASATQLRAALHLSNTDIGLLIAVTGVVGALATLPLGGLVDRINRTRLLAGATVLWAAAMAVCALAPSYHFLLFARAGLGAVTAVAVPAVASLVGDWFHPGERGRIYGFVLTGELVGAGFGFTVAGGLAALSWRASFLVLSPPAIGLALLLWRLPEPGRGGATQLPVGLESLDRVPRGTSAEQSPAPALSAAQVQARDGDVQPDEAAVVATDPAGWSLWQALRYVVSIRTNVILVVAGVLGYFFFSGVRAFGVEFIKGQYGVGQAAASAMALILGGAAVVGVLVSGTVSDWLTRRGRTSARLTVGAIGLMTTALVLVPGVRTHSMGLAVAALSAGAFALAGSNPPLDAARLDIMHPSLWGRAEAARTVLREPVQALAPLAFGLFSDHVFGGGQAGLRNAFLLMLLPLVAGAVVLMRGRANYPQDIATAVASIEAVRPGEGAA